MKPPARSVRLLASTLIAILPALSYALALDAQLDCKSNAHAFIAPLLQQQLIEEKPMRVEKNSVNAFRPAKGTELSAYDFRVYAVVGYQKDDPIFRQGTGEPIADSAYGAVVVGLDSAVEEKVRAAGSDAVVHHVAPFITAIFCKQD
ncbi:MULTISPECIES: hypothetical protein [unclassified Caballeronia]|uniref:hypothetical protein n=1 Tax=unclassified Caballeronia TaxID=2646786 RepID=UPI002859A668|nr:MULTISPECIES: hypothetical protein [unclassified Caballeronia]MDR5749908.1 hypothetical protein [Caballeronia sp. LZ024]MDR5842964.1 hypothetical protein [Caballeronia sp. LZ031]